MSVSTRVTISKSWHHISGQPLTFETACPSPYSHIIAYIVRTTKPYNSQPNQPIFYPSKNSKQTLSSHLQISILPRGLHHGHAQSPCRSQRSSRTESSWSQSRPASLARNSRLPAPTVASTASSSASASCRTSRYGHVPRPYPTAAPTRTHSPLLTQGCLLQNKLVVFDSVPPSEPCECMKMRERYCNCKDKERCTCPRLKCDICKAYASASPSFPPFPSLLILNHRDTASH